MREITVGVVAPADVNVPLWIAQERGFLERRGLAATERICGTTHGVTSALLVVARMVGMLVGISALTTVGLRRYYAEQVSLPAPADVCASGTQCAEYTRLLKEAGLAQLQTVFVGAAVCAAVAAVLALVAFRTAQTRAVRSPVTLGQP